MSWQNNGGNNGGGGDRNPWGRPPGGGGGGGRGGPPPDIDDIIRKGQDQLKSLIPGGGSWKILVVIGLALWMASGVYKVGTNEQGIVLRFGEWTETTPPGLHWHLPMPIETALTPRVTDENRIDVGAVTDSRGRSRSSASARDESVMLTGDENIVDVKFTIVWKINDAGQYLFNLADPNQTVKVVAESAMREVVGKNKIESILTTGRDRIQRETLESLQRVLDEYESGIKIVRVQITEAVPPEEVNKAFQDVQNAEADRERYENEAETYANRVVPEAEGQAQRLIQNAEGYRAITVARAEGESARFLSVYNQYVLAKDVTRKRIYLETMEEIFSGMNKIILDDNAGGVVPYLPLPEVQKRRQENNGGQNNE